MAGWVKVHRSLLEWEWWHDHSTLRLFLYLILTANIEDKQWQGVEVKRGQIITSRAKLSAGTGLSEKQIRTSLDKLKNAGSVASKSASKYSIITVCNYDNYQGQKMEEGPAEGQEKGQQRASRRATTKEVKNERSTSFAQSAGENTRFAEFWTAYPRKKNKVDAVKAWKQAKGDSIFNEIMDGLSRAVASTDWQKDDGQFIPYPASWLRAGGWMDEAGILSAKTCQSCRHYPASCQGKDETCSAYGVAA